MKRTSFLLLLGVAVTVIFAGYGGYVYWQKSASEADLQLLTRSITDYQAKVLEKESDQIIGAINARQTVSELKADLIEWSKVIKDIRGTIPRSGGVPLVQVLSYSGSSGSDIAMNVKTLPDREEPYFDVADLIASFVDSKNFTDVFVPSISAGTDEKGREVLTFLLSARYVQPKEDEELEKALSEVLDESLKETGGAAGGIVETDAVPTVTR